MVMFLTCCQTEEPDDVQPLATGIAAAEMVWGRDHVLAASSA